MDEKITQDVSSSCGEAPKSTFLRDAWEKKSPTTATTQKRLAIYKGIPESQFSTANGRNQVQKK
jgi:hypothetical protein